MCSQKQEFVVMAKLFLRIYWYIRFNYLLNVHVDLYITRFIPYDWMELIALADRVCPICKINVGWNEQVIFAYQSVWDTLCVSAKGMDTTFNSMGSKTTAFLLHSKIHSLTAHVQINCWVCDTTLVSTPCHFISKYWKKLVQKTKLYTLRILILLLPM